MKRYFDEKYFNRFLKDFNFLFEIIKKSYGEYDLRLRDNYFNLYYKGNSLAKVIFNHTSYNVHIHKKFITDDQGKSIFQSDKRYTPGKPDGTYKIYRIKQKELHPFFQVKYLKKMASRITKVNYGEEIVFEQLLITDNMNRDDLIIIDRQVTDTGLKRNRMDLLALKQAKSNKFKFVVLEVKLGKNPELKGKVAGQLRGYLGYINKNFDEWKKSYEKTYEQLKKTGLIDKPSYEKIEIIPAVEGYVVVGGYSGIAEERIKDLEQKHSSVKVISMKNRLFF